MPTQLAGKLDQSDGIKAEIDEIGIRMQLLWSKAQEMTDLFQQSPRQGLLDPRLSRRIEPRRRNGRARSSDGQLQQRLALANQDHCLRTGRRLPGLFEGHKARCRIQRSLSRGGEVVIAVSGIREAHSASVPQRPLNREGLSRQSSRSAVVRVGHQEAIGDGIITASKIAENRGG